MAPVFAGDESVFVKVETSVNTNRPFAEVKENLLEKKEQKQEEFRTKIATREAAFKQKFAKRVKEILTSHVKHQQKVLARLDAIAVKIQTRIDKLNSQGVDTTAASAKLSEAKTMGVVASAAVDTAKTKVDAIDTSSTDVRSQAQEARDAVKAARKTLFDYHKGLVAVLVEIKKLRTDGERNEN